jgi:protein CpxP
METMMNRLRTLLLIPVLASVLAGGVASAQGAGPEGPRRGGGGNAGLALGALNLTDAQQEQIRALRQQHREQTRAVAMRLREALQAQRNAAEAMPFNEQAIRATTQELVEAQTEMALQQARLRGDIYNLLTADQQAEVAKLREDRDARQAQRRQRLQQRQQRQPAPRVG